MIVKVVNDVDSEADNNVTCDGSKYCISKNKCDTNKCDTIKCDTNKCDTNECEKDC